MEQPREVARCSSERPHSQPGSAQAVRGSELADGHYQPERTQLEPLREELGGHGGQGGCLAPEQKKIMTTGFRRPPHRPTLVRMLPKSEESHEQSVACSHTSHTYGCVFSSGVATR